LQKFGCTEDDIHAALLSGDPHQQLVIAYNLIVDNRRIADESEWGVMVTGRSDLSTRLYICTVGKKLKTPVGRSQPHYTVREFWVPQPHLFWF